MIKRIIEKIFPSELGRGAFILFITINIFNLLNLLFHFVMARALAPVDYGTLAVLMSFIYLYSIPVEAIQNIISRYTSRLNLRKNYGKIKFFMFKSLKKGFDIAILIFTLATIISFFLTKFLNINFWLIFITNIVIFFSFAVPIVRGVLQGRKKFLGFGMSMIIEGGLKLFFAVSFVLLGFKIFGAMMGILFGIFAGLIFALYFNKEIIDEEEENVTFHEIYFTSIPYFTTMLAIFLFFSLDIIFAKRFFSPEVVGQYAVLSMLGKAVFLGTLAISKAMFPLASERKDSKKDSSELLKKSIIMVISLCTFALLLYGFYPKEVITLLYGSKYVGIYPYLIYSGLAFSFLSLSNLILLYRLSYIGKLKNLYYLFVFVIIEIAFFIFFHNTILEYIFGFMVSNIIMFIGSLFFIKR